MAEPTNPYANKKIQATDSKVKQLNIASLNKTWGALGQGDDKKKASANGLDPYQDAEQYCDEMDLSKVDNDNKGTVDPVSTPKKEASGKFEGGLDIESLNRGEWGYTSKVDGKKKASAGKGKFND